MNQCGSKTHLAVYLLVSLFFLVFEIEEWELFAYLGRVCQGQWGMITDEEESADSLRGVFCTPTYIFFKQRRLLLVYSERK